MELQHTPLEDTLLSADARRALVPGPARMMAARGLLPIPRPVDMLSVLYQLSLDTDPNIAHAAAATARDLPTPVLAAALADPAMDPRVLDRCAEWQGHRLDLVQQIITNRQTHGATIAVLAGKLDAPYVDLIAENQERMLRHPAIIGAMFHNPRARMSTVDRAIELAARHQVSVPRIPSWESVAAAALKSAAKAQDPSQTRAADELFSRVMHDQKGETADLPDEPSQAQVDDAVAKNRMPNLALMTIPQKIRLATLGNKFMRSILIRDSNRVIAGAAIRAPTVTENDAAKYAGNQSLADDVIKYIASRRDWTRSYNIKLALVQNPKTPIPDAIRFMPHLRERDLRAIARSKGVSSAVVAQARKLLMSRQTSK